MAPVFSVAGGDDTTRLRRQGDADDQEFVSEWGTEPVWPEMFWKAAKILQESVKIVPWYEN
jgi:hypothetical protein